MNVIVILAVNQFSGIASQMIYAFLLSDTKLFYSLELYEVNES